MDLQTALAEKHQTAFNRRLKTLQSNGVLRRFVRGWYVAQEFDLATLSQRIAPDSYVSFTTVLAQSLLIGTSPERRIVAAKIGRTRTYAALGYKIVHVGIAPHLFFGFETRDGVRYANKEKAVLDVLYFHLRGRVYPFDLYSDIRFDELEQRRIQEYLRRYKNPKFVAFAESVLDRKGSSMSPGPTRPATREGLILWVMHRFARAFGEHAIIEGGMALRLLDSPRSTNAIDYVFVPYKSKKNIASEVREILRELEDADVGVSLHSTMLRADIKMDSAAIQIESSVDVSCNAIPIATGGFARGQGRPSQIVRIMSLDTALAHKLAAWNERRLARDLYDCYFLASRLGESPDLAVLRKRLSMIRSQLPKLRRRRSMSMLDLARGLRQEAEAITQKRLADGLSGLLPNEEMVGLAPRIKAALNTIAEQIERAE